MKKHKNRIVAGIILGLILISVAPAMAEDISLQYTTNITQAGWIVPIVWSYTGFFEPNVTVELLKDGILEGTIASDTYIGDIFGYNGGIPHGEGHYYTWNVSVSLEPGMYQIKITGNTTSGLEVTNTSDIEVTMATAEGCKSCHPDPAPTHHALVGILPYSCADCHPIMGPPENQQMLIDRNCLNCHNGTAFWVNPLVINPGPPHLPTVPPPPDTPPVINSVTLSTNTPNTGDNILVTVNATDDVLVTSVMANGILLTKQSNDIWNGNITAIEGTHSVNVSASDGAGHVTWDNSTSYTATTPNIIVTSPMTGDNWVRGTTQTIRWNYVGDLGNYAMIELLEQGRVDQTWNNVSQSNGIGSYNWAIPYRFKISTYQIRVSADGLSNTTGNFNIVKR